MIPYDLRVKDFIGMIVYEKDSNMGEMKFFEYSPVDYKKKTGRYLVHIPELMPFLKEAKDGIWCYNAMNTLQIDNNMKTGDRPFSTKVVAQVKYIQNSTIKGNKDSMLGAYTPMLPGVKYIIKFVENDINSGHIMRQILHDTEFKLTQTESEASVNPNTNDGNNNYMNFGNFNFG